MQVVPRLRARDAHAAAGITAHQFFKAFNAPLNQRNATQRNPTPTNTHTHTHTHAPQEVKLTGCLSTNILSEGEPRDAPTHGILMSPGLNAQIHQHFFCARLDLSVDDPDGGAGLSVVEVRVTRCGWWWCSCMRLCACAMAVCVCDGILAPPAARVDAAAGHGWVPEATAGGR